MILKYPTRIWLLGITLILAFIATIILVRDAEFQQVTAFADYYAQLHSEGDVVGILELFHWDNVPHQHINRLHLALNAETRYPLARIQLQRASAKSVEEAFKKTPIALNLSPRWQMQTVLATEDRLSNAYWLGRNEFGQWKIAGAQMPK
jgi:hypothetical protein